MAEIKKKSHEIDMLNGPLLGKIMLFAMPLALSSILQQCFNAVDTIVAGQLISAQALAAVGCNSTVISLFLNLFVGMAVGVNAVLAMYIGERHREKIQAAIGTVVVLALFCGIFTMILGIVFATNLLVLISTPDNILVDATLYLQIYLAGMPCILFYNFGSAILRSKGDTSRPLYALIASGVVNLVLDLVFVIFFHWDIVGVAVATTIANAISAALICYWLMTEEDAFRLVWKNVRVHWGHMRAILYIGVPAGIQGLVFALSNVCVQSGINTFGDAAIAGSAAALNAELVSYYFVNAFVQAAVTFTAQNYAAGEIARCKRVFLICMGGGLGFAAATNVLFVWMGAAFLGIFTTSSVAIGFGIIRLWHVEALQFMVNSYEISAGAMRGLGSSMIPAAITIIGTCALRFAWVFLVFPMDHDFGWLLDVYPVSWLITGSSMLIAYAIVSRRAYRRRQAEGKLQEA